MAPLDASSLGPVATALVNIAIGLGFGFVLERAGFGNARKLAAQFFLADQSVLKVMFTAIIVAMVLLFASVSLGLLNFEAVWVNPTYLWPGIIGGLLLGVGFIIGGYCPGTSVVAAATLKLDGLVFVLGCLAGVFVFGQSVGAYQAFWEHAGYLGRLTIPEWLGLSTGVVVLLVVLMALGMFVGAEFLERRLATVAGEARAEDPRRRLLRRAGAGTLLLVAFGLLLYSLLLGDPVQRRLRRLADAHIASRALHAEPAEVLGLMHNRLVKLVLLDVRDEADYNLFHLADARSLPNPDESWLAELPADSIKIVMCNDEARAEATVRELLVRRVPNVYLLAGGVNGWLDRYGSAEVVRQPALEPEMFRYDFASASGASHPSARPEATKNSAAPQPGKVRLRTSTARPSGGCAG